MLSKSPPIAWAATDRVTEIDLDRHGAVELASVARDERERERAVCGRLVGRDDEGVQLKDRVGEPCAQPKFSDWGMASSRRSIDGY